ncbi:MAG: hypothetical protein WBW33_15190 [Bryobacteraceae bacterium]
MSLDFDGHDPSDAGYIQLPCRVRAETSEALAIQTAPMADIAQK